jgi:Asp-tRNA(Asn)/Glu-tRNA(Gln) amidotransferase C subunit
MMMIQRSSAVRRLIHHHFQSTTARSFKIPSPTWSLKDLNLTASTEPVSEEELQTLAKRALIDVTRIEDTQGLRQDLANMMHYLEQVQSVDLPDMTTEEIYDAPRNLTAAPVRTSTGEQLKDEAAEVLKQLLQEKGTKYGAHDYFSVVTKKEETL